MFPAHGKVSPMIALVGTPLLAEGERGLWGRDRCYRLNIQYTERLNQGLHACYEVWWWVEQRYIIPQAATVIQVRFTMVRMHLAYARGNLLVAIPIHVILSAWNILAATYAAHKLNKLDKNHLLIITRYTWGGSRSSAEPLRLRNRLWLLPNDMHPQQWILLEWR